MALWNVDTFAHLYENMSFALVSLRELISEYIGRLSGLTSSCICTHTGDACAGYVSEGIKRCQQLTVAESVIHVWMFGENKHAPVCLEGNTAVAFFSVLTILKHRIAFSYK